MLVNHLSTRRRRKGIILLVVISLLTLFAVVGLSFVLYSEGSANSARIWREARQDRKIELEIPPLNDEDTNTILGELVFGVPDSKANDSMWYGHDIASAMYGWKYGQPMDSNINTVAYGGLGLQRLPAPFDNNQVRFSITPTLPPTPPNPNPRKPEHYPDANNPANQVYVGKNDDSTYPGQKDFYLAAIDPLTGRVLAPSFHRDYLFNWAPNTATAPNTDVTVGANRVKTLRPHPVDHPQFPMPLPNRNPTTGAVEGYGDVENLPNKTIGRQYDSYWMDIGFSVRTIRGKKYKPLIAPLIIDLDNRLNINVAGNVPVTGGQHESNQGWGPWEMNLARVLNHPAGTADSTAVLRSAASSEYGRFGPGGKPIKPYEGRPTAKTSEVRGGSSAPPHSNVDFDGSSVALTNMPGPVHIPLSPTGASAMPPFSPTSFSTQPIFSSLFANGGSISASANERTSHPAFYNPYYFNSNSTLNGGNRSFTIDDFRYLNAKYDYDASIAKSDLHRVFPALMPNPQVVTDQRNRNPRPRWWTTPISNDLDRVGYAPWADYENPNTVQFGYSGPPAPDAGLPQPFAQFNGSTPNDPTVPLPQVFPRPSTDPNKTDFTPDWQSKSGTYAVNAYPAADPKAMDPRYTVRSGLAPLDLSRPLVDYRTRTVESSAGAADHLYETANNVTPAQAQLAIQDRQLFARDLFTRLVIATFGLHPNQLALSEPTAFTNVGGTTYPALQWLAQLAANMVDYIDGDEYMTPFNWNPADPTKFVYGTEMPRLVINEVYSRWVNDPRDLPPLGPPPTNPGDGNTPAVYDFQQEIFLELMNPLTIDTATMTTTKGMSFEGGAALSFNGNKCYRVTTLEGMTPSGGLSDKIRDWQNAKGENTDPSLTTTSVDLGSTDDMGAAIPATKSIVVAPFDRATPDGTGAINKSTVGAQDRHTGFYVIGPKDLTGPTNMLKVCEKFTRAPGGPANALNQTVMKNKQPTPKTFLLERLLCPQVPFNATFNPYVTVDFVEFNDTVYDDREYNEDDVNSASSKTPKGKGKGQGLLRKFYSDQRSWGREQPYSGYSYNHPVGNRTASYLIAMASRTPPGPMTDTDVNQTFFLQNRPTLTPDQQYHWLRHLDRVPINAMELLAVSAHKPHELTHKFIERDASSVLIPNQHLAQWFDYAGAFADPGIETRTNQIRLSRFLGLVSSRSRMFGIPTGGRIPGRVNVNTVWGDPAQQGDAIFQAAFDPQNPGNTLSTPNPNGANQFTDADIRTVYGRFLGQRSPNYANTGLPAPQRVPSPNDQPLFGAAAPIFGPTQTGVSRTLLRPNLANGDGSNLALLNTPFGPNAAATYDPNKPHPYYVQEPLTKTMPNLTTRSNCFLMICTVGYFEYDDLTTPGMPRLGKEIGNDDGSTRRDKFMAVIDRTNLSIDPDQPGGALNSLLRKAGPKPVTYPYEPISVTGSATNDYDFLSDVTFPATITVRVPTAYQLVNGNLTGFDDGGLNGSPNWVIVPKASSPNGKGTYIQIDTGDNAETVEVTAVNYVPSNGSSTDTDAGGGEITFQITKPHRRGALMLFGAKYLETGPQKRPIGGVPILLGNPGPQKPPTDPNGFDYRKEPFNAVVPYVAKEIE